MLTVYYQRSILIVLHCERGLAGVVFRHGGLISSPAAISKNFLMGKKVSC